MVTLPGILLAAGAGSRMGMPKALVRDDDGEPWLRRGVQVLRDGGCDPIVVVLGASADEASALLEGLDATIVLADDWADGMAASFRTGLTALAESPADSAVISLVDLPDLTAEVVRRVVAVAPGPHALARASYDGTPGHPVVLGREHWAGVLALSTGDRGARSYLAAHQPLLIECGDLATGRDRDHR